VIIVLLIGPSLAGLARALIELQVTAVRRVVIREVRPDAGLGRSIAVGQSFICPWNQDRFDSGGS
jgi:hypothetical protein